MNVEFRAVPVWHLIILALLSFILSVGAYAVIHSTDGVHELIIFVTFFGSLFCLFLYSVLFSKVRVHDGSVSYRLLSININEVEVKYGGRLLSLGRHNWFLVLNPKEAVKALRGAKGETSHKPDESVKKLGTLRVVMPILLLMVLWMIDLFLNLMSIHPIFWCVLWAIVTFASFTAWAYWLQHDLKKAIMIGVIPTLLVLIIFITKTI